MFLARCFYSKFEAKVALMMYCIQCAAWILFSAKQKAHHRRSITAYRNTSTKNLHTMHFCWRKSCSFGWLLFILYFTGDLSVIQFYWIKNTKAKAEDTNWKRHCTHVLLYDALFFYLGCSVDWNQQNTLSSLMALFFLSCINSKQSSIIGA